MKKPLLILLAGLLLGADGDAAKQDLAKMQGDWVAVKYTADGKAADAADLPKIKQPRSDTRKILF
jgi:hypothetical protein